MPGHASLPNGFGLDFVDGDGQAHVPGVAPNALTSTDWRDAYAGTPWHKHVPARIEAGARCGGSETEPPSRESLGDGHAAPAAVVEAVLGAL